MDKILNAKYNFLRVEDAPFIGGYKTGSLNDGEPTIFINLEAIIHVVKDCENKTEAFHDILLQTLTHEFCHSLQEWLGKEYDELEVEKILGAYNDKWNVFEAEEGEDEEDAFNYPAEDFLRIMDESKATTIEEFKEEMNKVFMGERNWYEAKKKHELEKSKEGKDNSKAGVIQTDV